ncbi:MAG: monovalent cation:proton antiporter-2 (CPA2) family protein [Burkholderiales bacterium]|nr:monovalent cation:proton antiporter-2 (CPA2) family protein [Burkholderiales bacterium]
MHFLAEAALFLAAAVVVVPLFKRIRLGAVLGFLAAGLLIGPWGLRLVTDVDNILGFAELGVVLLLFVIGLELQPSRLWALRKAVFGLGSLQVGVTAGVLGAAALAFGASWQGALVIGVALSLNSTAFVLQLLAERRQLTTRHGRSAFAISLFQDLSVIPLLAVVPLLVEHEAARDPTAPWIGAAKAVGVIAGVVIGGRLLLRPVLRVLARSGIQEIFTAGALLVVVGVALLMESVGLSMTLGAFLAGVLLADSEYRHEVEASIDPFKGLLLGLFFIAVGMKADVGLLLARPGAVLGAAAGIMAVKAAVLAVLGAGSGHGREGTRSLAVLLSHAGEFAFVLLGVAAEAGVVDGPTEDFLVITVTLTMAFTPVLFLLNEHVITPRLRKPVAPPVYDTLPDAAVPVIIAGFGRVGQIVGRVLRARHVGFTALDISAEQIENVRRFGSRAYFGDASKLELLRAARADEARLFVIAVDDVAASIRIAETLRKHFPALQIHARARNRFHAHKLMALGVKVIVRETFHSSIELAHATLTTLGDTAADARDTLDRFRQLDEEILVRQFAVHEDEARLIQTSKEAAAELESIFDQEQEARAAGRRTRAADDARVPAATGGWK